MANAFPLPTEIDPATKPATPALGYSDHSLRIWLACAAQIAVDSVNGSRRQFMALQALDEALHRCGQRPADDTAWRIVDGLVSARDARTCEPSMNGGAR